MRILRAYNVGGFTLLEMVVVVAIVAIITGVILANFRGFQDRSSLDLVAQQVATVIRQAQVYGVSQTSGSVDPDAAYGVSIWGGQSSASPSIYVFQDTNTFAGHDQRMGDGTEKDVAQRYYLPAGITLSVCSFYPCGSTFSPRADITFQAKYPEPACQRLCTGLLESNCTACLATIDSNFKRLRIQLDRPGMKKFVDVWINGQVSVGS